MRKPTGLIPADVEPRSRSYKQGASANAIIKLTGLGQAHLIWRRIKHHITNIFRSHLHNYLQDSKVNNQAAIPDMDLGCHLLVLVNNTRKDEVKNMELYLPFTVDAEYWFARHSRCPRPCCIPSTWFNGSYSKAEPPICP